jgi:cyclase
MTAVELAVQSAAMGAGEILLSSIDRDGTMEGYDLALIREVSQAVDVPVIASGGCRDYEDMLNAFKAGADACAAGALFAFTDSTPRGAAQFLNKQGLEVRL